MAQLSFGVLGALEIVADGRPLVLPAGRRRAVLACLLVHLGHSVSADALIDAGWGDDLPGDPRSALNTVISRLRTLLGGVVARAGPAGYVLDVPESAVDAYEFEELRRRGESTEPAEAVRLLGGALGLWRGPAYSEFADAEFARLEAQRLERLRLDTIEAYAATLSECGDTEAAIAEFESLLAEHPFREHAVEQLVITLYHAGRQAEALDRYRAYRTVLADELGLDPSPALTELEARILGHELPAQRPNCAEPTAWLDTSTAFIGRDDVLQELVSATATNRLVTVTGPGGVGKSRLVAEALPLLVERLTLPIAVVELAEVTAGRIGAAVADALGIRPDADSVTQNSVTENIVEYLSASGMVLVLDNCEHLIDDLRPMVALIGRRCPRVHVIATSRRRLGSTAELVLPLSTLPFPRLGATAASQQLSAAVRLFTDRVRRLRPSFGINADNTDDVAALCRHLDGLPLALELAASRAAVLGVEQVRERLPADVVSESSGDLYSMVEWSYRLLDDQQRRLLACLSVFAGEFSARTVRGMTAHLESWDGDTTAVLAELAESSLIAVHGGAGEVRYRMLTIVRSFAGRALAVSDEASVARLAHAEWVREATERIADDWTRRDGAIVSAQLDGTTAEIANAVEWASRSGRMELASSITGAVMMCLHWTPGLELSDLMIEVAERGSRFPGPRMADGVAAGAFLAAERGELERARYLATSALRMSAEPDGCVAAQLALGVAAMYAGDHDESAIWFERIAETARFVAEGNSSLALLRCYGGDLDAARRHADIAVAAGPAGSDAASAFARYAAGEVAAITDPVRGSSLLAQAVEEADRVGAEQVSRVARVALFALLVRGARHDEARDLGVRLLHDLWKLGAWPQLWTTLRIAAELLAATQRPHDAAILLAATSAAPSAPPLRGEDIERYAGLGSLLSEWIGEPAMSTISDLAASIPRSRVVDRAERDLSVVSAPAAPRAPRRWRMPR